MHDALGVCGCKCHSDLPHGVRAERYHRAERALPSPTLLCGHGLLGLGISWALGSVRTYVCVFFTALAADSDIYSSEGDAWSALGLICLASNLIVLVISFRPGFKVLMAYRATEKRYVTKP